MKKNLLLLLVMLFACTEEQDKKDFLNKRESPKYNIETFAVVWKTVSMRKEKLEEIVPIQTKQLKSLWDQGIVENVYFKTDEEWGSDGTWPNIMFFIKAENKDTAKEILNEMEFVKHKLAIYELHPVGVLWLKRNENSIKIVESSKRTFGVVWASEPYNKPSDEDIKLQSKDFTELWNNGLVENAYFDIVGASTGEKDRPTMVNFVNASNEDEAHEILSELHFIKSDISTYMLFDVGVLWLGTSK